MDFTIVIRNELKSMERLLSHGIGDMFEKNWLQFYMIIDKVLQNISMKILNQKTKEHKRFFANTQNDILLSF